MNNIINLKQLGGNEPIYHYTKTNGVMGILRDKSFFATRSDFLNDINEMNYALTVVDEVLKEIPNESLRVFLSEKFSEYMPTMAQNSYYVTCFSNHPDSLLLWSEFGEKTGYNLMFNSKELIDRISEHRKIMYHGFLIYDPDEQKNLVRKLIFKDIPCQLESDVKVILNRDLPSGETVLFKQFCKLFLESISVYSLFFKQKEFADEREYRMIFREKNVSEIGFREKDGFLLPYIEVSIGKGYDIVRKATVAPKNHIDLARSGIAAFAKHYGYDIEVEVSGIKLRY